MNIAGLVRILSLIGWLIFFASIALVIYSINSKRKVGASWTFVLGAFIVALTLTIVSSGLVFVQPQERAVVISASAGGIRPEALQPGVNWIMPFLESIKTYSVAKSTYTMSRTNSEGQVTGDDSVEVRTIDGQKVNIDASVIYSVDPTQVVKVHLDWQDRYESGLVRPVTRGIIRDVMAQYKILEVYSTKRGEIEDKIRDEIRVEFARNGLLLDSFFIRDIAFTEEYAQSIEQKQIAEQQAEQAKFVVQQRLQEAEQARALAQGQADAAVIAAEAEAQAQVLAAQAEAEAIKIKAEAQAQALREIGEALSSNPDLLQYTYVQNLSDNVEIMLVPSNSPYLFNLPELSNVTPVQPE
ncbi:MAG TPA: prohibitin family protein [Anaerolineales bacterium]|nr:prohibitin family protein [Anaerolineales bacterium]